MVSASDRAQVAVEPIPAIGLGVGMIAVVLGAKTAGTMGLSPLVGGALIMLIPLVLLVPLVLVGLGAGLSIAARGEIDE